MPHEPPCDSMNGCFLPSRSTVPPEPALPKRLPSMTHVSIPSISIDVRHLVLVALRCPLGEQIVALRHVGVRIDDPDALGQFRHRSLLLVLRRPRSRAALVPTVIVARWRRSKRMRNRRPCPYVQVWKVRTRSSSISTSKPWNSNR